MGIEYTQVYTSAQFPAGLTGNVYIPLNPASGGGALPAGTVFSVKFLSVSTSSGFSGSIQSTFGVSSTNGGAVTPIYIQDSSALANTPLYICTGSKDPSNGSPFYLPLLFINQPYFVADVSMAATGIFRVTIVYSIIPADNPLIQNFGVQSGVVSAANPQLFSPVAGATCILKSIIIMNLGTITAPLQYVVWNDTTSQIVDYLDASGNVGNKSAIFYYPPFFLQEGSDLSLAVDYDYGFNFYTSYTTDLQG